MTLQEQFEKETGKVAHHQDEDESCTQFSYEYTLWLEAQNEELKKELWMLEAAMENIGEDMKNMKEHDDEI